MQIQQNISLNDKNWYATGGSARFFCEPTTETEFVKAVHYARDHSRRRGVPAGVGSPGGDVAPASQGPDGPGHDGRARQQPA